MVALISLTPEPSLELIIVLAAAHEVQEDRDVARRWPCVGDDVAATLRKVREKYPQVNVTDKPIDMTRSGPGPAAYISIACDRFRHITASEVREIVNMNHMTM